MRNPIALILALLALAGCATPTTGIVQNTGDYMSVAHQGATGWVATQDLRVAATKEAQDYCTARNKEIEVVYVKEIPAGAFGRWPEADVVFKCR